MVAVQGHRDEICRKYDKRVNYGNVKLFARNSFNNFNQENVTDIASTKEKHL